MGIKKNPLEELEIRLSEEHELNLFDGAGAENFKWNSVLLKHPESGVFLSNFLIG